VRHGRWLLATALILLGTAAPASAAQRFASPGGSGSTCASGSPCDVVTAINGAGANDEVILAGGSYPVTSTPLTPPSFGTVSIHSAVGSGLATINTSAANGLQLNGPNESLRDVIIQHTGVNDALSLNQATGERLMVHSTAGDSCRLGGTITPSRPGTLLDSVCWTDAASGRAIKVATAGQSSAILRNVTGWAANLNPPGSIGLLLQEGGGGDMDVTATNAILYGAFKDVVLSAASGTNVHLTTDHSNYEDPGGIGFQGTGSNLITGSGQSGTPVLVDPPPNGVDFRQKLGSPTIDAGVDNPLNGTLDFMGDPRTIFAATDIGGDEWNPATAQTGGASAITQTSASIAGLVTPNGNATNAFVEYGPTTAYGSETSPKPVGSGTTPVSTGADLTGLTPGTTYHYRLVATNVLATDGLVGGDGTFTTVAAPSQSSSSGGSSGSSGGGTSSSSTPLAPPPLVPSGSTPIAPQPKKTVKKPSCRKTTNKLATSAKKKKKKAKRPACRKPKRKRTKKK
jgi:hypothetical protein